MEERGGRAWEAGLKEPLTPQGAQNRAAGNLGPNSTKSTKICPMVPLCLGTRLATPRLLRLSRVTVGVGPHPPPAGPQTGTPAWGQLLLLAQRMPPPRAAQPLTKARI